VDVFESPASAATVAHALPPGALIGHATQRTGEAGRRVRMTSRIAAFVVWSVALGNLGVVVWLWLHGGNLGLAEESIGGLLTSLGRLTALIGTYLVLLQVLMLARIPILERAVGFDRLTVWHRRNGKLAITLVVAHVPLIIVGYALTMQSPLGAEIRQIYSSFPGMVTATIGTAVLIAVVVSSLVIARRRLSYEAWYLVHLASYAGILLAYFHQIPTGNELSANASQRGYWYGLYAATIVLLVVFRVLAPLARYRRHGLRVAEVRRESRDVVSVYIEGRGLERLGARGGQFFIWRFLSRGRWWQAHPFSLSSAPDGRRLRITVKDLGDFTSALGDLRPGTRVMADGPFGSFTAERCSDRGVVLIAGGIGIAPLRAMLDEFVARGQPVTVIQRARSETELVLRYELVARAIAGTVRLIEVVSDCAREPGHELLGDRHLRELVPDIESHDVFVCGPPRMMSHVRTTLRSMGIPARHIHSEHFSFAVN
jgi:predicted ferric reductase